MLVCVNRQEEVVFWADDEEVLLTGLQSSREGLASLEAARRLETNGPNRIGDPGHATDWALLVRQVTNPIVVLLMAASILSFFLGDAVDSGIILVIVVASASLGFIQERGAVHAVRSLLETVRVHADVRRDGEEMEVVLDEVVAGDIVVLRAGDVVPADCRILTDEALHVEESALTGESFPVHKRAGVADVSAGIGSRRNSVFLGTHITSGSATVVVVRTGVRPSWVGSGRSSG